MKKQKPLIVCVGGHNIPVVFVKKPADGDNYGAFLELTDGTYRIELSETLTGEGIAKTLAHELCHASLNLAGLHVMFASPQQEEAIVCCMETLFLPALRQLGRIGIAR